MATNVTPQPMPTTGMPDRVDSLNPPTDFDMRAGVKFGNMSVNPGRSPTGPKPVVPKDLRFSPRPYVDK
jgi:hypothetical protein